MIIEIHGKLHTRVHRATVDTAVICLIAVAIIALVRSIFSSDTVAIVVTFSHPAGRNHGRSIFYVNPVHVAWEQLQLASE